MRTTKTQTRWEPYVKLLNFFNVAASLKTVGRILHQEHQIISESSFMVELITFWVKVSLNNLKRISQKSSTDLVKADLRLVAGR